MADTFSSPFAKAKDEYRPKRRTANGLVNRPPLPEQTARTSPPTFLFPYSLVKERFADIETTQPVGFVSFDYQGSGHVRAASGKQ